MTHSTVVPRPAGSPGADNSRAEGAPVPAYMNEVYDWAYVDPRNVRLLDRNAVVRTLLFGNDQRLMRAYLDLIEPGMRVWQAAHVYGDLVKRVAARVGAHGHFDLSDITPIQIERAHHKLDAFPQAHIHRQDAAAWRPAQSCDVACSFFLLHEVPEAKKHGVVDNVLAAIKDDGIALFVDYHRPAPWHPVGWLLRWVNAHLEPFAHALWENPIESYARDAAAYTWQKQTVFGGIYQIVSARRREATGGN